MIRANAKTPRKGRFLFELGYGITLWRRRNLWRL
nr:MAG TPA: hypothetical protein [Caudoviricetes sp.]